jgi:hypothetical protein
MHIYTQAHLQQNINDIGFIGPYATHEEMGYSSIIFTVNSDKFIFTYIPLCNIKTCSSS